MDLEAAVAQVRAVSEGVPAGVAEDDATLTEWEQLALDLEDR